MISCSGSIWETQQSQDLVIREIRKLTSEIRATKAMFPPRPVEAQSIPCDDLTLAEMLATQNIQAWRQSAESLAVAVTLYEPDKESVAGRAGDATAWSEVGFLDREDNELPQQPETTPSINGHDTTMSRPDSGVEMDDPASDWDPEPDKPCCLSAEIIQFQIAAIKAHVKKLVQSGLYFQAEQSQRKLIELQDQLLRTYNITFPDRAEEEELWADILRSQGTKDGLSRSKEIFLQLLKQEMGQERASDRDNSRCCRYYHKLGEIYSEFVCAAPAMLPQ